MTVARGLLLALALGASCRSGAEAPPPRVGADGFVLVDAAGVERLVRASDAQAAIVVNFWATWCDPCKEEFPLLVETARAYRDRGVRFHFVSLDFPGELPEALRFLEAQGVAPPRHAKTGPDDAFIRSVHPRWSGALPATVVYGPRKELRYFWEGQIDEATLREALETLTREARG